MNLIVFENNKPYVVNEFRQGRFDYIELASDVAETKFFQFLFDNQVVEDLAEHYPSPRQRHHVPMWMYLSAQISMRLHGSHSFPWIIRSGGLIDALGADEPIHPTVAKRERKRQETLADKKEKAAAESPPDPKKTRLQTWIARFQGLTSWSDCPVPLTGVYSRDVYADGHEKNWLLVTTSDKWSACKVRDYYGMRTDIEERNRHVKCFWDLTRFHSTSWSLIVSQTVFVCLTYSLLQVHLLQHGHQELNRRTRPTSRRLLPDGDRVVVYRQQYFAFFTLMEHMELTLSLEDEARRKALAKTRRLRQDSALVAPIDAAPPPTSDEQDA